MKVVWGSAKSVILGGKQWRMVSARRILGGGRQQMMSTRVAPRLERLHSDAVGDRPLEEALEVWVRQKYESVSNRVRGSCV